MILSSLIELEEIEHILKNSDILNELNEHDRNVYKSFNRNSDKASYIGARFLLRELSKQINPQFELNELKYTTLGKPYCNALVDMSMSHSGSYSMAAVTDSSNIGIDIQDHRAINIDDYKSLLSDGEISQLSKLNAADQVNCFYEFWTIKEAIMKADGRGFHLNPHLITKEKKGYLVNDTGKCYYCKKSPELKSYSTALVSDNNNEKIKWYMYNGELTTLPI